ncbi:histidine phosphatase family protein [Streptococcus ovuberis]|uniref:Phosphoglycerate mutase n=1 Tax=Streptococcus ovuberis TaxID=1936207 RepID=A0A7X6N1R7_9STRE|nr:hypothetical protein [Streptococcus ovuberis]
MGGDRIVILVRHGEDFSGYRGSWSSFGLTDLGRDQSRKTADFLAHLTIELIG